MFNHLTWKC